jgi:Rps23 Pro-64 3,4-dihydroxylase Tpa1-like proline 4-hydroxylase
MEFKFIYDPVKLIVIRNLFTSKENEEIFSEAVNNENTFQTTGIMEKMEKVIDTGFRNNISSYYDVVYDNNRSNSKLLTKLDELFSDRKFINVLSSSTYPINTFADSNHHETQVSRYGDEAQEYKYHMDYNGLYRNITIVYYFNKEPKEYKGGEIQFTRSPIYSGIAVDKNEIPITITPENNMAVIFGSKVSHRVLPTTSPKTFDSGRFSVNCWLGKQF